MTKRLTDEEALEIFERGDPADWGEPVWNPILLGLVEAVAERRAAEDRILDEVRKARANGASWMMIGPVLGVSYQAAIKKYRDKI